MSFYALGEIKGPLGGGKEGVRAEGILLGWVEVWVSISTMKMCMLVQDCNENDSCFFFLQASFSVKKYFQSAKRHKENTTDQ